MTASLLLKLFIGITILLIVCIPEWFKTKEGISEDLSCIDPCMMDSSYILPLICNLQENKSKEVVETVAAQNGTLSSITLGFYMNTSAVFMCYPQRNANPLSQVMSAQGKLINVSLNVEGKNFYYPEVESNFVKIDFQEDEYTSVAFSLEIHISNFTEHNRTMDQLHYQDVGLHHDFINVSLYFESRVSSVYTRPLGIVWLFLISLVFICGFIIIIYKVKQEKRTHPVINNNQERSSIPRPKEEHSNESSERNCYENHDRCKPDGQKNENFYSSPFLPVITEQQDTVFK
ncbi:transmembrane protein 156 [Dendropsophus ebraccatus]|uniref:transmembrane protein 156 n=1 Tax=Dendropsophus ebraccatus TaxID=150705 RepID=UPI0038318EB4